jgi:predicted ferric reductase
LLHVVKPRLVYPALFRSYNVQPILRWFHLPTLGQSVYIGIMAILATLLSTLSYVSVQPNSHYKNVKQEMFSRIGARTGVLAMGMMPLVFLFAGRNNVLLWISNWSHGTFILLHRWVARILGILLILHSVFELALHIDQGEYKTEVLLPYWIWGTVSTLTFSIMLIISVFRGAAYEWFLVTHIILAAVALIGVWYHLELLFEHKWGYQYYLYLCFAIWGFDRLLRIGKLLKNGLRNTHVRPIGQDILRVDVDGIKWDSRPGQHAYVSFPSLRRWTPWENHPFSVVPTHLLRAKPKGGWPMAGVPETPSTPYTPYTFKETIDSATPLRYRHKTASPLGGITFFVKRNSGFTARLWAMIQPMSTLIEGPYQSTSTRPVLQCDRLILIGGGIGITALFPFVAAHPNVKLNWSMRDSQDAMIQEIEPALEHVESNILVNQRLNVTEVIQSEVRNGWIDIGIVVCGPGALCDDVRREAVRIAGDSGVKIELDVDAFSW